MPIGMPKARSRSAARARLARELHPCRQSLRSRARVPQGRCPPSQAHDRAPDRDEHRAPEALESELDARYVDKETLLRSSDYVSLHVPLLPQTHHYIGENELKAMKKTAYLINSSRGPVIDEAALARGLRDGEIAGAGLDVFEREPLVDPLLLTLDNVVLAPHIASATVATRRKMAIMAAENAIAVIGGHEPPNRVA